LITWDGHLLRLDGIPIEDRVLFQRTHDTNTSVAERELTAEAYRTAGRDLPRPKTQQPGTVECIYFRITRAGDGYLVWLQGVEPS